MSDVRYNGARRFTQIYDLILITIVDLAHQVLDRFL